MLRLPLLHLQYAALIGGRIEQESLPYPIGGGGFVVIQLFRIA